MWEHLRVAEGSATVALTIAEQLGHRIRYASPVARITVGGRDGGPSRSSAVTANGERFEADAVVCAVPVGPLRNIRIDGVSAERLGSLDRQRHALAAKAVFVYPDSFWEANGQNGAAYFETAIMGGTWVQRDGIVSALVPPERLAPMLQPRRRSWSPSSSPRWPPRSASGARPRGRVPAPLGSRSRTRSATSPPGVRAT